MSAQNLRPWREIATELSQEKDPVRTLELANELEEALAAQINATLQIKRSAPTAKATARYGGPPSS
jgi:hypothetical protein